MIKRGLKRLLKVDRRGPARFEQEVRVFTSLDNAVAEELVGSFRHVVFDLRSQSILPAHHDHLIGKISSFFQAVSLQKEARRQRHRFLATVSGLQHLKVPLSDIDKIQSYGTQVIPDSEMDSFLSELKKARGQTKLRAKRKKWGTRSHRTRCVA